MSRRGEITVECDSPGCHAEIVLAPEDLLISLHYALGKAWWTRRDDRDICPHCSDEGK